MARRFVALAATVGLGAVLALGTEAAQASSPAQPAYWVGGAGIKSAHKAESVNYQSRLWVTALNSVVRCKNDEGKGEFETKGRGKWEATYKECEAYEATENTEKEFEEGEELSSCTVKSEGAGTGEINLKGLKSRLVWGKGEELILSLYEPEKNPWTEIVIEGSSCSLKGTYKLEGSMLASIPRINEEELVNIQDTETSDTKGEVTPIHTKWEAEEEEGKKAEGTAGLKLGKDAAALEDVEPLELAKEEGTEGAREPFAIHE